VNYFAYTKQEAQIYMKAFDLEQTVSKLLKNECICDEPADARRQFKCPVHAPHGENP